MLPSSFSDSCVDRSRMSRNGDTGSQLTTAPRSMASRRFGLALSLMLGFALLTATISPRSVSAGPSAALASPNSASLQVERLYRAYFERAPEPAGRSYWTSQRLGGRTLDSISDDFAKSTEFVDKYGSLSNEQFVIRVYDNVLRRSPDAEGRDFWTAELDSGRRTRGQVMVGFSESTEFVLRLNHLDRGPVQRLYRAFFLRDAEDAGLNYWFGQQIGGMPLAAIAEQFAITPEFITRYGTLTDRQFVQLVYRNVLKRDPEISGLDYWTGQLTSGRLSRGEVMVGFSESPEFSGNPTPAEGSEIGGCQLFPRDSFWYASVADLPVLPQSDAYVNRLGADKNAHPNFGSGLWQGNRIGIPYTTVDSPVPQVEVGFRYANESDPSPYPIPQNAPIEAGSDRHILVVESGQCVLHEIFAADWQADGSIEAGSGARWDLTSNDMRPDRWTSGDAAGLPILPGLVRYEEVASGSIDHVIRFTANVTDDSFVWPASHFAGSDGSDRPPMGSWIRLKSSVNPDDFTGQAKVIVVALQEHGAILADNGSSWFFIGAPNEGWDNDNLRQIRELEGNMFEFVDASSLQVAPNSYEAFQ